MAVKIRGTISMMSSGVNRSSLHRIILDSDRLNSVITVSKKLVLTNSWEGRGGRREVLLSLHSLLCSGSGWVHRGKMSVMK